MQNATKLTGSREEVKLFVNWIQDLIQQDFKQSSRKIRAHIRVFIGKQRVWNKVLSKGRMRYCFSRRRPKSSTSTPQIPLSTSQSMKLTGYREVCGKIELALSKSDLNQQEKPAGGPDYHQKVEKCIDEH